MEIFCRIDTPKTLILSCSLVCRHWLEILSSRYFWIIYIKSNYHYELSAELRLDKTLDLRRLAVFPLFDRNLIENPSGEKGFIGWELNDNGEDRFSIEEPPVGCHESPDVEIRSAFAASSSPSLKHTIVDLRDIGEAFLDKYRPPIIVSDYYTTRYDSGCIYFLNVRLLTEEEMKLRTGISIRAFGLAFVSLDDTTSETSIFRIKHLYQGNNVRWQKIEHVFTDYPSGIRYIFFEHGGIDIQFWEGHYGPKMAKASVVVALM